MTLCYIDTETTGLDPRIHQPYEVCFWREDEAQPTTYLLPHTLEHADPKALEIGRYFERGMPHALATAGRALVVRDLAEKLRGVTLVGSNPGFDAAMLTRFIGVPVWHHHMIDVAQAGTWLFGWDHTKGLGALAEFLRGLGHKIPEPDHTATGDVRATRAIHEALIHQRDERISVWHDQ